jgi:hypothetical protein
MSQIDENQIHERLKRLSHVEPTKEAADRAMQKVRDVLTTNEECRVGLAPPLIIVRLMKLAAAAVLMISAGYIGGRLSAPEPLDVKELQAALEGPLQSLLVPAVRQELFDEMNDRWQKMLAASNAQVKEELARQVRRDLEVFDEQTLTSVGNLMNQRLMEFARMIEVARIKERQRVAAAFDYMGSRFGDGLVTLAARTDDLLGAERAGLVPDVSEK